MVPKERGRGHRRHERLVFVQRKEAPIIQPGKAIQAGAFETNHRAGKAREGSRWIGNVRPVA